MLALRFTQSHRRLAAAFILIACAATAARAAAPPAPASFDIAIVKPQAGGLSDTDLSVGVIVSSTFELSSVKAQVEGREVVLAFSSNAFCDTGGGCAGWAGTLSLAGLARGPKTLNVTATDTFGNTGQAQQQFVYDQPPRVNITNPASELVTGVTVHVTATCADDDPAGCKSLTVAWLIPGGGPGSGGILLQTTQPSVDQDVTLPTSVRGTSIDGRTVSVTVTGTDSAGQMRSDGRVVNLQTRTRLVEVESYAGRILDVQPDRVLLLDRTWTNTASDVLRIRTRATGDEVTLPTPPGIKNMFVDSAFLAPKGAVFAADDRNNEFFRKRLYEWRDGALVDLGELFSPVEVRGGFALWEYFDTATSAIVLVLRDLTAGTTTEVARGGQALGDLAANGDVVYASQGNIFRFRGGTTTQLTNDAQDFTNGSPVTDGINVVYQRQPKNSPTAGFTLTLLDSNGARADLSTLPSPPQQGDYQAAGGWVAFPKPGVGGVAQFWTRAPDGSLRQVSFFGTQSALNRLGSDGGVTFYNTGSGRIYLRRAGDPLIDFAAGFPSTFSLGGQWYAFIGRTLFRLPTAAEVSPVLITDDAGRAVALDSVTHQRDPFDFSSANNFSADRRTRLLLFATNVDWLSVGPSFPLTAQAEDAQHRVFPLTVEYAAPRADMNWMAEIVVRLPDELSGGGDVSVTVNVAGFNSNPAKVSIKSAAP